METVELIFQYTQDEHVKAERQYLFASKTITKTNIVVFSFSFPLLILYLFLSSFSLLSIVALGMWFVLLTIGSILYFYIPIYKFKQTSKYHEEYTLIFSKDGIRFKTPTINSELKWDIYSALWESNDFYFLIQAPRIYALIPKRAFSSLASQQAFEEMALVGLKCAKRAL